MTTTTATLDTFEAVRAYIEASPARSCWSKAVREDAADLIEGEEVAEAIRYAAALIHTAAAIEGDTKAARREALALVDSAMLNGASDWAAYSWGGCALIYNGDIAAHYCTPSEYRARRGGDWKPSRYEEWLDVQARALSQAARLIRCAVVAVSKGYRER